jgi:DNA-binding MarR family transcriptional regulator
MWRDKAASYWINLISRTSRAHYERTFAPYKLSSGSYGILMVLFRYNGITQNQLCSHLIVHKANITRALQKLEKEGYVRLEQDSVDSRTYRIFLTQKAREARPKIDAHLRQWNDNLLQPLTSYEREELLELLKKIAYHLHPQQSFEEL